MSPKTLRVNGKDLSTFDEYDGTEVRAQSRRLLAYDDAVREVEEGGGPDLTVWFDSDTQAVNWEAPDGFEITRVSTFESGSMGVCLEGEN
ncbi:hypothetical protein [Halosimplex sp. J119]